MPRCCSGRTSSRLWIDSLTPSVVSLTPDPSPKAGEGSRDREKDNPSLFHPLSRLGRGGRGVRGKTLGVQQCTSLLACSIDGSYCAGSATALARWDSPASSPERACSLPQRRPAAP